MAGRDRLDLIRLEKFGMQAARDHVTDTVGDDPWVEAGVVFPSELNGLVDGAREPFFSDGHVVSVEAVYLGRLDHLAGMDVGPPDDRNLWRRLAPRTS
jgi:hypothetical protein